MTDTLLPWLLARRVEMLDQLRAWVECESPSREPDRIHSLGRQVGTAFAAAGARVTPHALGGAGDGLQVDWGKGPQPPWLLLGHLDTVYPAGTLARMPFQIVGDRICGPGVLDMKGGIVAALFAFRALQACGARIPPARLLLVPDEEVGSRDSRPLTETLARQSRGVLVLEPGTGPAGHLKTARKGIALYSVRAEGRAAHAGVDFEAGASAVGEIARQVVALSDWSDAARGLTVNAGVITGGTRSNVVAAEASAQLDVRAWDAATLAEVDSRLRALTAFDPRVRVSVSGGLNRPPMEESAAARALFARARDLGAGFGLDLEASRTGGGSDGNFTAALGVPTLDGLGAAGEHAHSPDEYCRLDLLAPRTALLAALLIS